MKKYCIGIDLGGTFVKFCLLDGEMQLSDMFQLNTPSNPRDVVRQMVQGARELMARRELSVGDVVAVGIGSPGPLDLEKGRIISMPNIPGMEDMPIRDEVAAGLSLPATLENDANAAAYGEYLCGGGKGTRNMVLLTLGTGVGCGIIIDGKLLHGSHGIAGEVGHMIVEPGGELCGCGQHGCLERYCSATHIAQRATRRIQEENCTGLLAAVLKQKESIDAKDIQEAAAAGDRFAVEVWEQCAYYLAVGCLNMSRIFDPDKIILGGGMTLAGEALLGPLKRSFRELDWSIMDVLTKIEIAKLGNDAGAIGAGGVAWSAFG